MKKITLKDGTLLFLPEEYAPSLLDAIEHNLGTEARDLVEELVSAEQPNAGNLADLRKQASYYATKCAEMKKQLEAEQEEHSNDIAELEDELASMRDAYVMVLNSNTALTAEVKRLEAVLKCAWKPVGGDDTCATCPYAGPPNELVYCAKRKSHHLACQQGCEHHELHRAEYHRLRKEGI
jgi:hypothetical protein